MQSSLKEIQLLLTPQFETTQKTTCYELWCKPSILTRSTKTASLLEDTNVLSFSSTIFLKSILFSSIPFPSTKKKQNKTKQSSCSLTFQIFMLFNLFRLEVYCFTTSLCIRTTLENKPSDRFLSKFKYEFSCTLRV